MYEEVEHTICKSIWKTLKYHRRAVREKDGARRAPRLTAGAMIESGTRVPATPTLYQAEPGIEGRRWEIPQVVQRIYPQTCTIAVQEYTGVRATSR